MTDIRGIPAIPRPDMFIGQEGITPPGYSYLNELATVLGEVRSLLSTVEGVTETNTAAITELQGVEPAPAALKRRYPVNVTSSFLDSGTIFLIQAVQGAAGDIVTFPPLLNVADAASWDLPSTNRDGFTTIETDVNSGVDSVHAISFYMDDFFLYDALRFTRSSPTYSVTVNTTYPFGSGFSHTLPDDETHDFSLQVRPISGGTTSKEFRVIMRGYIDVYEPAAPTLT